MIQIETIRHGSVNSAQEAPPLTDNRHLRRQRSAAATALDLGEKAVRAKLTVDRAVEDGMRAAEGGGSK